MSHELGADLGLKLKSEVTAVCFSAPLFSRPRRFGQAIL